MSADILHFARMDEYPNRIKALRNERGWSQEDLASRVGCSKMQISGLERGKPVLDTVWMRRLAEAMGVTPADLLSDADNPLRPTAEERRLLQKLRHATTEQRETLERVTDAVIPFRHKDVA